MSTTVKQNRDFAEELLPHYPLDTALEWIARNMDPADVFAEDKLEAWAEGAGFTRTN